jgi:hypothetical protein
MSLALVVLLLASAFRVFVVHVEVLSNFSPVMALAFCAGAYTRNRWMWIAPFLALIVSDIYINHYYATVYRYEWSTAGALLRILCFAAALGLGVGISRRRNWLNMLGGTLAGSFFFYLVSNTASWHGDLGYTQNLAGWWQAVTVGHPELPRERSPIHGMLRPHDGVLALPQGRAEPPRPKAGQPLVRRASSARPSEGRRGPRWPVPSSGCGSTQGRCCASRRRDCRSAPGRR